MSLALTQRFPLLLFISFRKRINNLLRKSQKFNEDEFMLSWFMLHAFIVYQHTQNKIFMGLYFLLFTRKYVLDFSLKIHVI